MLRVEQYTIVIFESDESGCSAYVPDLPGCISAGDTIEAVRELIAEAMGFHIEGLRASGEVVPRLSLIFPPVESDSEISYELIAARF